MMIHRILVGGGGSGRERRGVAGHTHFYVGGSQVPPPPKPIPPSASHIHVQVHLHSPLSKATNLELHLALLLPQLYLVCHDARSVKGGLSVHQQNITILQMPKYLHTYKAKHKQTNKSNKKKQQKNTHQFRAKNTIGRFSAYLANGQPFPKVVGHYGQPYTCTYDYDHYSPECFADILASLHELCGFPHTDAYLVVSPRAYRPAKRGEGMQLRM